MEHIVDRVTGRIADVYTPPEDRVVVSTDSRTIDGVTVEVGLRVIDYDLHKGTVECADRIIDGVVWWTIALDNGRHSRMDGLRLWTRLRTNSGVMVAAERD